MQKKHFFHLLLATAFLVASGFVLSIGQGDFVLAAGGPNEPAGMLKITERAFNAKVENGWTDRGDAAFSIGQDSSAPVSPSNVGQALFNPMMMCGTGPINTASYVNQNKPRTLYVSYWIKYDPNWVGNKSGVNKMFFIWIAGGGRVIFNTNTIGNGPLKMEVRLQGMGVTTPRSISWNASSNINTASSIFQRGQWAHQEVVLVANTPGVADGEIHYWLNGVKVGQYTTNVGFSSASETGSKNIWDLISWNPTYGGGCNNAWDPLTGRPTVPQFPSPQWMQMDHVYVSGSPNALSIGGGTTPPPPPDTTPPTVSISSPVPNATVSGTISITANASDNTGVAGVQFKINGTNQGAEDTTSPYTISLDTTTKTNGSYSLTAVARDGAGNTTTSSAITININNVAPPTTNTSCANEPSGMIWSNSRAFDAKVENGWTDRGDANFSIVQDPTAPMSPPNVGQANYPTGFPGGQGPIQTQIILPAGIRTLYLCTWIKLSNPWNQATAGVIKSIFFGIGTPTGGARVYSAINGTFGTTGGLSAGIDFQGMGTNNGTSGGNMQAISWNGYPNLNVGSATIPRGGPWKKWEILLKANTPGQYDGEAHWWINGVKVGQYTAIGYSSATETGSSNTWRFVNWNPTYGGSTIPVPAPGQQAWYDHFYLSGSPIGSTGTPPPTDTTPPTVSITAPAASATLSGTSVAINASASDNIGVAGVQFKIDGTNLGPEDTISPYSINLNTTTKTNGLHTLTATARDAAGNSATSTNVTININNTVTPAPTLTFTANPTTLTTGQASALTWSSNATSCTATGAWSGTKSISGNQSVSPTQSATYILTCTNTTGSVNKSATITVHAPVGDNQAPTIPTSLSASNITTSQTVISWNQSSDNVGVTGYKVFRNGIQIGTSTNPSFTSASLNPSTTYSYAISAYDAAGNNSSQSVALSVTTQNLPDATAPTVSITAPLNNVSVLGNINITATATDNVGVVEVRFKLNGTNLGAEDISSPYSVSLDTLTKINGSYTLTAVARDAAGNTTTSSAVNIVINNVPVVSTVSISPTTLSLSTGLTSQLTAFAKDATNTTIANTVFTWASGNSSIASVSSTGLVTANTVGSTTITATASGKSANIPVTVSAPQDIQAPTTPSSLSASNISSTYATIYWNPSTDNVGVVGYKVFRNGAQVGISTSTNFTDNIALSPATTYTYNISAYDAAGNSSPQSQALSVTTSVAPVPCSINSFVATPNPVNAGQTVTLSWDTSGNCVAGILNGGEFNSFNIIIQSISVITAPLLQTTIYTLNFGSVSKQIQVTVTPPTVPPIVGAISLIEINPKNASLILGKTSAQLSVVFKDASGNIWPSQLVTWEIANPTVVSISNSNVANAIAVGTTTVTAKWNTLSATINIEVLPAPPSGGGTTGPSNPNNPIQHGQNPSGGTVQTPQGAVARPARTLVKYPGNPTVYLLENNIIHPVPSQAILNQNYGGLPVATMQPSETYTQGATLSFGPGALVKPANESTVYLILDNNSRYPFKSLEELQRFGYQASQIKQASTEEIASHAESSIGTLTYHAAGTFVKYPNNPTVYKIENNIKRPITSLAVLNLYSTLSNVITISEEFTYTDGEFLNFPDGSLIKGSDNTVYLIDQGLKRAFTSAEIFSALGYSFNQINTVPDSDLSRYSEGVAY